VFRTMRANLKSAAVFAICTIMLGMNLDAAAGVRTAPIGELRPLATFHLGKTADWVAITPDAVWVGSTGPNAVHRIDPQTSRIVATVNLRGEPCAGLTTGFGSLWVPLCGKTRVLAKVNLNSNELAPLIKIGPAAAEGGITTSPDSVWLVLDKHGSLARIDPVTGAIRQTVRIPAGSYNPFYSEGQIWVTRAAGSELTSVDAASGALGASVRTGPGPRFLTAGSGAVWTLNQGDGSLTRIDMATRQVTITTALGTPGHGGDISFGDGVIWTTMPKVPLMAIDAATGTLLCRWIGPGGDSLGIGHGAIWLTDYHGGTISRIDLGGALTRCRSASGATMPSDGTVPSGGTAAGNDISQAPPLDAAAAERFAELALKCLHQEYPSHISHTLESDTDARPPHELTPSFYGCYDWHSDVHGHWLLVRLVRLFPDAPFAAKARAELARSLTAENIAGEVAYFKREGRASFERPYGLAWLLQLAAELRSWKDPQAQQWSSDLRPLESEAASRLKGWLPKLHYPIRIGEHDQTAFSFGLIWDWAGATGDQEMRSLLADAARRFYLGDRNCPLSYEPSGEDFLSPCLAEADFMRRVLDTEAFARWLSGFLPDVPRHTGRGWLQPAIVTDRADPKLAHLDGLNLSRAWMLEGMAQGLPATDGRVAVLRAVANQHREAALPAVTGEHYEGGHWLGTFAVYLWSEAGLRHQTDRMQQFKSH
jgi:streptogramin lyase